MIVYGLRWISTSVMPSTSIDLVRTSGIGGQYYKYANFGDMRTQGIELSLSTTNIETKELSWSSSLTPQPHEPEDHETA